MRAGQGGTDDCPPPTPAHGSCVRSRRTAAHRLLLRRWDLRGAEPLPYAPHAVGNRDGTAGNAHDTGPRDARHGRTVTARHHPELGITTLRPGGTITLPATVGYTITDLHFTASDGYRLHLALVGSGSYSLDLPLDGPTGTVTIPRDKMLPGKRDLAFTVVREGDVSAWSTQHATHVADVTIYGPK